MPGMFVETFHSYFLSPTNLIFLFFLMIHIFSKMLTDKYHRHIQVSVRCKIVTETVKCLRCQTMSWSNRNLRLFSTHSAAVTSADSCYCSSPSIYWCLPLIRGPVGNLCGAPTTTTTCLGHDLTHGTRYDHQAFLPVWSPTGIIRLIPSTCCVP